MCDKEGCMITVTYKGFPLTLRTFYDWLTRSGIEESTMDKINGVQLNYSIEVPLLLGTITMSFYNSINCFAVMSSVKSKDELSTTRVVHLKCPHGEFKAVTVTQQNGSYLPLHQIRKILQEYGHVLKLEYSEDSKVSVRAVMILIPGSELLQEIPPKMGFEDVTVHRCTYADRRNIDPGLIEEVWEIVKSGENSETDAKRVRLALTDVDY